MPGLSDLPIVGRLFAKNHKETKQTDVVLMLTPRIIRLLNLTENDLRPFRVGRDSGGGVYELPLPRAAGPAAGAAATARRKPACERPARHPASLQPAPQTRPPRSPGRHARRRSTRPPA